VTVDTTPAPIAVATTGLLTFLWRQCASADCDVNANTATAAASIATKRFIEENLPVESKSMSVILVRRRPCEVEKPADAPPGYSQPRWRAESGPAAASVKEKVNS
jgi:hypothetical protein